MTNSISRRSATKGAAWAIPAVSVAAATPALAASSTCTPQTITSVNLAGFKRDQASVSGGLTTTSGTLTMQLADGTTMPVQLTHTANGASLSGTQDLMGPASKQQPTPSYSGIQPYLMLQTLQSGDGLYNGPTQTSTLTFTFPQPVSNFSFTIGDIDKGSTGSGGAWDDHVTVSPAGGTYAATAVNQNYNQTGGNQVVTVAGPTTTITLSFSNGGLTGAQNFAIGSFGTTATTACP